MNGVLFFFSDPNDRWAQAIAKNIDDPLTHVGMYKDGVFYEQALQGFTAERTPIGVPLSSPRFAAFISWDVNIPHMRPSTTRDYVAWHNGYISNVCTDWAQRGMGFSRPKRMTPRELLYEALDVAKEKRMGKEFTWEKLPNCVESA